jgi:hypothetical protein
MPGPKGANWRKDRKRRQKRWPKQVEKANAAYDKLHGPARVIPIAKESA